MNHFDPFDAVRIAHLPNGLTEIPANYSQTGATHIRLGDIGVVIGDWPGDKYRVEAVNSDGAIEWQDQFAKEQLELLRPTAANFSRRRINEHWAFHLGQREELLDNETRQQALTLARKVMMFARRNIELLIDRLDHSGYRFANSYGPFQRPEDDISNCIDELANRGVFVPVALHAWLMEVGAVDFAGSHPDWSRSAYSGFFEEKSGREIWFTDPLVVWFNPRMLEQDASEAKTRWIEIAPDVVHKSNVSGGAPVWMSCQVPAFDTCLVGQHGSFTLLSYLRYAFEWSGFPGFEYIPDAPREMLVELGRGLTRL